jgi:hypothetical protein
MSRADEIRAERKERGSEMLNGTRTRLPAVKREPGWVYRHANQLGDRVYQLQSIGYEVVSDRSGKMKSVGMGAEVSAYAGTNVDGSALKTVLMRIPEEIYHEDQASKQRAIDETEAGIARGNVAGASPDDQSKIYGGMKITAET